MKATFLALLLSAAAALPLRAQPAAPHAMRDSIAALVDTAALRTIADAGARSTVPLDQLRRGFAALRLHELTRRRAEAEQARAAFERARDLAPGDVFAELGLGLSLAALADAEDADVPTIVAGRAFAEALGFDARSRARRSLERALEAEPALAEAAAALARVALASHEPDALRAAHAALVRVTVGPAASAGSWLARARTALALGEVADALAAADAALAIGGPLRPDALHVRARALLRTGGRAQEGARAYFEAARAMTPATSAALLEEILELTDPTERAHFETLSAAGRVSFLERFWDVRAGLAGETVGERLAEHQRRLALAHARYRRQAKWGAVPLNALLRERPDGRFDDRGLLLVRHGEPVDIIRTVDRDLGGNESWLYTRPDGEPFMAHFVEYGDFSDYVLIYNVPCAPAWIADRLGYDARMNVLRNRCSTFDQRSVSHEIRRDVYAALASDSDPPAFAADLPFAFDLHTFRGAGGATELLLSAAVPGAALRETADAAGRRMRAVTLALAVVDTQTSTVTRAETFARALADTVHAHVTVSPPAARDAAVRVLARDAGDPLAGRLRGRAFTIPAYTGDTLMISDVLLAAPASSGGDARGWERGGVRIALAPGATFDAAGFRVFAEIYNLPAGESYVTEVRVERAGGGVTGAIRRLFGGGSVVRLRFEEAAAPAADGVVRVLRDVRSDLAAGDYLLTLRIVPANGSAVERQARLRIGGG